MFTLLVLLVSLPIHSFLLLPPPSLSLSLSLSFLALSIPLQLYTTLTLSLLEIFHVKELQSGKIQIYGFTYDPNIKWFLTVEEHSNGRVEDYPRFRHEQEVCADHTVSIQHYLH